MKKLSLPFLFFLLTILSTSCKKEVNPEIEITVVDENRNRVGGAIVETSTEGAQGGVIGEDIVKRERTDNFGKAYFEFKNTVLVDVFLIRAGKRVDSTSVLAETKRKSGNEKNVYERTLVFK